MNFVLPEAGVASVEPFIADDRSGDRSGTLPVEGLPVPAGGTMPKYISGEKQGWLQVLHDGYLLFHQRPGPFCYFF